jgi:hypothetical protein
MERAYPRVFHPGGVSLRPRSGWPRTQAAHAHDIDIQLVPVFAATLTGTALDASGRPVAGVVRLSPSARSGALFGASWSAPLDSEGRFVARGVPSGEYVATAVHSVNGKRQFGVQYVTVLDPDPTPAALTTIEGATISARVLLDGLPFVSRGRTGARSLFIAAVGESFLNRFGTRVSAFEDPQALEQLAPPARSITLRERGRLTLDLDRLR